MTADASPDSASPDATSPAAPDEGTTPGTNGTTSGRANDASAHRSSARRSSDGGTAEDDAAGSLVPGGIRLFWPLALSLGALGAVAVFTFEPGAFWTFARAVNPWLLGGAFLLSAVRVFFGGWRLQFVSGGRLGLAEGVRGQLAWDFLSNLTPTAVGGGPLAIVYLARDQNIPVGEASAFMLFSMVLDQLFFALAIPTLLAASALFNIFPDVGGGWGHWTFFVVFCGLLAWSAVFAYATLVRPHLLLRLAGRLFSLRPLRRFRHRVVREATRFAERARRMRAESLGFYAKSFLLTLGIWAGRIFLAVIVVWSVYPALDVGLAALRSAALLLLGLVMPTPSGAGGLEGLYALFFGPLMPEALMAPTLLAWRFLGYYVFVALGVYLSFHQTRQELERR